MPRNRRKAKGASASASKNDQNRPSESQSSSSLENVKHAAAATTSANKRQNRAVASEKASPDSSANPIFQIGDRNGGKKEKSSSPAPISSPTGGQSKSSTFWSSSPAGILKTPARKISDVGAAIKRKLKQNFAVSFLLDASNTDDNLTCGKVHHHSRNSHAKMNEISTTSADYYLPPSGPGIRPVPSANTLNRLERQDIVIWRHPIQTLKFFFLELGWLVYENTLK